MSMPYSVICMHGLGASADNLRPLEQTLSLPNVRFIFPQAPTIPVTINQGYPMPAWYDVKSSNFASAMRSDNAGVDVSCQTISGLIANEQAQYGIPPEQIFLMGFSQGGSIALELGLHADNTFAGIIGLSTLPAKAGKTFENLSAASRQIPIFLAHGTEDHVVPFAVGQLIQRQLQQENYSVEWVTAAEDHTIWAEEMAALRLWLLKVMR